MYSKTFLDHHCLPSRRLIFLIWLSYVQGNVIVYRAYQLGVPTNTATGGVSRIVTHICLQSFSCRHVRSRVPLCGLLIVSLVTFGPKYFLVMLRVRPLLACGSHIQIDFSTVFIELLWPLNMIFQDILLFLQSILK